MAKQPQRKALGKGLGALLSKPAAPQAKAPADAPAETPSPAKPEGLVDLPIESIKASPWQPRKHFDESKLRRLATSIDEQGLIQPVVVRPVDNGEYELIAGERRLRAMKLLGRTSAPAIIKETDDGAMALAALVENLQRDNLNPIETAEAYVALQENLSMTQSAIAQKLGMKSHATIANTIRLLDLPAAVRDLVAGGALSAGTARALLSLASPAEQIRLGKMAVEQKLSARQVEQMVRKKPAKKPAAAPKPRANTHVNALEDRLRDHFKTKVSIQDKQGKGRIVLEYYSHDDVDRILRKMGIQKTP